MKGWYIGPSLNHYRCYRVYVNATRAERIIDTIEFFPETKPRALDPNNQAATIAANDLIDALMQPQARPTRNEHARLTALQQLSKLFTHQVQENISNEDKFSNEKRNGREIV